MKIYEIDINCDLGEKPEDLKLESEILDYISSVNIACGYHAGNHGTMRKMVRMAMLKNVAIGAHPGFQDLEGFGRREVIVSPEEVFEMVVYQMGALQAFLALEGISLNHVKPHGALYNMAAVNPLIAEAIAEAVYKLCPEAILFGLAGSELIRAGKKLGLVTASEVFADRTYQLDGTLTSRTLPEALIADSTNAVQQVLRMIKEGKVLSLQGEDVLIKAETVCLHGDSPKALDFARSIHEALKQEAVMIRAFQRRF